MRLTIERRNLQEQLLGELQLRGITQASVALTYAFLLAQEGGAADWARVNEAIRQRWKGKTALTRVKEMAWKQVEIWRAGESPSGQEKSE